MGVGLLLLINGHLTPVTQFHYARQMGVIEINSVTYPALGTSLRVVPDQLFRSSFGDTP